MNKFKSYQTRNLLISGLTVLFFISNSNFALSQGFQVPKKMAVYHGQPSKVNNDGVSDFVNAINHFSNYDLIVLGNSLQWPQPTGTAGEISTYGCDQNRHVDHDNTVEIIRGLVKKGIEVFGYVSIGGENTAWKCCSPDAIPCSGNNINPGGTSPCENCTCDDHDNCTCDNPADTCQRTPNTFNEIKERIDLWRDMNVSGIFLDEVEYGFGTSRKRMNKVIEYIHDIDIHECYLKVFVNGFNPDQVFSTTSDATRINTQTISDIDHRIGNTIITTILPHGYVQGDWIEISNSNLYNGEHQILNVQNNKQIEVSNFGSDNSVGAMISLRMNRDQDGTSLLPNDLYMLESFGVSTVGYEDFDVTLSRADGAARLREEHGVQIAVLPRGESTAANNCLSSFDRQKFDYAWWATYLFGFQYFGWSEPNGHSSYGICSDSLPYRERVSDVESFGHTAIIKAGPYLSRSTEGVIMLDSLNRTGRFSETILSKKSEILNLNNDILDNFSQVYPFVLNENLNDVRVDDQIALTNNPNVNATRNRFWIIQDGTNANYSQTCRTEFVQLDNGDDGLVIRCDPGLRLQQFVRRYEITPGYLSSYRGVRIKFVEYTSTVSCIFRLFSTTNVGYAQLSNGRARTYSISNNDLEIEIDFGTYRSTRTGELLWNGTDIDKRDDIDVIVFTIQPYHGRDLILDHIELIPE